LIAFTDQRCRSKLLFQVGTPLSVLCQGHAPGSLTCHERLGRCSGSRPNRVPSKGTREVISARTSLRNIERSTSEHNVVTTRGTLPRAVNAASVTCGEAVPT
jgi:hypothetical protein